MGLLVSVRVVKKNSGMSNKTAEHEEWTGEEENGARK